MQHHVKFAGSGMWLGESCTNHACLLAEHTPKRRIEDSHLKALI